MLAIDLPPELVRLIEEHAGSGRGDWLGSELIEMLKSIGLPATANKLRSAVQSGRIKGVVQDSACNNHYFVEHVPQFYDYLVNPPPTGRPRKERVE